MNMIIFGYHSGTQNTRNSENVKHLKWGRLERGHLKLCGISQQVLTITIIIKKSALSSSFRKYLTPRSYLASLTIYLQIHLYSCSRCTLEGVYIFTLHKSCKTTANLVQKDNNSNIIETFKNFPPKNCKKQGG